MSVDLEDLQAVARQQNVPEAIVKDVLGTLSQQSRVIELDRDQPEFRQSFSAYLQARVNQRRVERALAVVVGHRHVGVSDLNLCVAAVVMSCPSAER